MSKESLSETAVPDASRHRSSLTPLRSTRWREFPSRIYAFGSAATISLRCPIFVDALRTFAAATSNDRKTTKTIFDEKVAQRTRRNGLSGSARNIFHWNNGPNSSRRTCRRSGLVNCCRTLSASAGSKSSRIYANRLGETPSKTRGKTHFLPGTVGQKRLLITRVQPLNVERTIVERFLLNFFLFFFVHRCRTCDKASSNVSPFVMATARTLSTIGQAFVQ